MPQPTGGDEPGASDANRPSEQQEEEVIDHPVGDQVRQHYEEMAKRGAEQKGEGRIA